MILGIGIDLADVAEIRRIVERYGTRFCDRVFSNEEQAYCESRAGKFESYAARFAVKEAVLKALRLDQGETFALRCVTVRNDAQGRPSVELSGRAALFFKERQARLFHISITHTKTTACAVAVLEGKDNSLPDKDQ